MKRKRPSVSAKPDSPILGHGANIGRRRANAIALADSPARRSHSQQMARIFKQAQETILFQDEHARLGEAGAAGNVCQNLWKQESLFEEPQPDQRCEDHDFQPLKQPDNIAPTVEKDFLPEWLPLGQLSEELPCEMMPRHEEPIHVESVTLPQQVCSVGAVVGQNGESSIHENWPRSVKTSSSDSWSTRSPIEDWLEGIIAPEPGPSNHIQECPRSAFSASTSFDSSHSHAQGREKRSSEFGKIAQKAESDQPIMFSPPRRTIRSLLNPTSGPIRFNFQRRQEKNASDKFRKMPTQFRPRKIPARPLGLRRELDAQDILRSNKSNPAKSQVESSKGSVAEDVAERMTGFAHEDEKKALECFSSREDSTAATGSEVLGKFGETKLAKLSPNVDTCRRKTVVQRPRVASYFDEDIFPELSPRRVKRRSSAEGKAVLGEDKGAGDKGRVGNECRSSC